MFYKTIQKQSILQIVQNSRQHPTTEQVYQEAKKILPKLSFATVYRNLEVLTKKGLIKRIVVDDSKRHYDGLIDQHQHFVCKECGSIIDMQLTRMLNVKGIVEKMQCHQVDDYCLQLEGVCSACLSKKDKLINDKLK